MLYSPQIAENKTYVFSSIYYLLPHPVNLLTNFTIGGDSYLTLLYQVAPGFDARLIFALVITLVNGQSYKFAVTTDV